MQRILNLIEETLDAEVTDAVPLLLVGNELMCLAAFAKSNKYHDVFETNRRMLHWLMRCLAQQ